jgi:hypothetical protein
VTTAPTLVNARTVQVTLGPGVSIFPGVTTIAFNSTNDAIQGTTGALGKDGTPVLIASSDGVAPTVSNLTLDAIDDALNGRGPAGGTLQVFQYGFTIDLAYGDNTSVDTSKTQITADVAVSTSAGPQPAGTNLTSFLTATSVNSATAKYTVPNTMSFPQGAVTLSAIAIDVTGLASVPATFAFTVKSISDALRPFETSVNPAQVWFIDLSRDVESYSTNLAAVPPAPVVQVTDGPNGRPDIEDIMIELGLLHTTPIANVQGSLNSNQVVLAQFKAALLVDLAVLYSSVNVQFTFTRPSGTFPSGSSSPAYGAFGYSQICIAGAEDPTGSSGVLGVAIFDAHNATQNDDCQTNFTGGQRLGVFLQTIVNDGVGSGSATLFRQTFDPFTLANGGTRIGADGSDGLRLTGALNDTRATRINTAIAGFARFTAVVLAHECGHSVGLVQDGAMPAGLYGGDATNFPGSTSGHINAAALFPAGALDVMTPAISYNGAINAATAFNSLCLAYLREQAIYN